MSNVEQLLKSPSDASVKVESAGMTGNDVSANANEPSWNSNEATIAKVVQEVVRNICHGARPRKSLSRVRNYRAVRRSKTSSVDDCVEAVIRSQTVNYTLLKSKSFPPNCQNGGDMMGAVAEDIEGPPKLTAIRPNFDQYRYRKRRKRRLFGGRRPTRRYPMKLSAASNGADGSETPRRKRRPKLGSERNEDSFPSKEDDRKISQMDAQVHDSVFSPDKCALVKLKKRRRNRENSNGAAASQCWHSSLNEKLFPHLLDFKSDDLSKASSWSVDQVSNFVKALPACPPLVAEKFRQEQIDGQAFLLLTQHDIVKLMNIRLGPAVKIHNAIMLLKHKCLNADQN